MVSLREIIYLHMYSCYYSELLENSLCQFCFPTAHPARMRLVGAQREPADLPC